MPETREISIPAELYEKAESWIRRNGGFSSVDELVKFLLEEFVIEDQDVSYSPEEEKEIKERLKRLGYI